MNLPGTIVPGGGWKTLEMIDEQGMTEEELERRQGFRPVFPSAGHAVQWNFSQMLALDILFGLPLEAFETAVYAITNMDRPG